MRNPILHVFLHCEDLENHIQDGHQTPSFKKIFLTHCTPWKIIKYVFEGFFWYALTIMNVVSNYQIQDVQQTPSLKECYL